MRSPALLIIALCLIGALFGWKAQEAWFSTPQAVDSEKRPSIDLGPDELGPIPRKDLAGAVAAISARSLFRPDRSFFGAGESGDGRGNNQDLSRLSMVGVVTFGGSLKGIVVAKDNPRLERWELQAGDSLLRFRVKEIREDGIVLTADGREFVLHLYAGPPTGDERSLRSLNTRVPQRGFRGGVPVQQHRTFEDGDVPGDKQ